MKYLVRFGKRDRLKFISHLDLQRTFQFALNRSDLPVAYSKGFTPHALMSFGSALAMGWTSEYEVFEFRTEQSFPEEEVRLALSQALPPDLPVLELRACPDGRSATMALVRASDARVTGVPQAMQDAVPDFLAQDIILGLRKTKSGEREIDIRPLIFQLEPREDILLTRLALSQEETLKPELLLQCLGQFAGVDCPRLPIHRTALLGLDESGQFRPVMEIQA